MPFSKHSRPSPGSLRTLAAAALLSLFIIAAAATPGRAAEEIPSCAYIDSKGRSALLPVKHLQAARKSALRRQEVVPIDFSRACAFPPPDLRTPAPESAAWRIYRDADLRWRTQERSAGERKKVGRNLRGFGSEWSRLMDKLGSHRERPRAPKASGSAPSGSGSPESDDRSVVRKQAPVASPDSPPPASARGHVPR